MNIANEQGKPTPRNSPGVCDFQCSESLHRRCEKQLPEELHLIFSALRVGLLVSFIMCVCVFFEGAFCLWLSRGNNRKTMATIGGTYKRHPFPPKQNCIRRTRACFHSSLGNRN